MHSPAVQIPRRNFVSWNLKNQETSLVMSANHLVYRKRTYFSACSDSYQYARYCGSYKRGGYCNSRRNFMLQHCRKTCGLCSNINTVCSDTSPQKYNCKGWKKLGYCRRGHYWYKYMAKQCRKTCRLCRTKKVTTTHRPVTTKKSTPKTTTAKGINYQ